ncbi:MurR/RpiR family transcriptional regulator [Erysipelothrix sp. HDW6C]|uniref:MurR/RpiR family transcriptional regulator n=1 Tax=Erysipelothrix sp. HDW6C TaxID=2714930 RepID=UPI00140A5F45|nr:MurR/RpiR family transcriptional regulator [Erysipelothrix sp. HDW6C]QIK69490.1 MurR/RpiR family transcriptional regulator [Erysipelothrix sp. HDW6C]
MFESLSFEDLSQIDISIVTYVTNNLPAVSHMRIRDLADSVHVAPSTVMRFIRKVGYESYSDFRVAVQAESRKILGSDDDIIKNNIPVNDMISLGSDCDALLDQAVAIIEDAPVIYTIGIGSSAITAEYAALQFNYLGHTSIHHQNTFLPILWNEGFKNRKTLFILFSTSGETREIVQLADTLSKGGSPIISITNGHYNSLAKLSVLNIPYFTKSNRLSAFVDLSTQIPAIYVVESLTAKLYEARIGSQEKPL